jgi:ribosome-associated translation inhibitor RaiA
MKQSSDMQITTQHRNLRSTDKVDSLVEERILALQPRLQIGEAKVCLEYRWEESPAYRVGIHLVTPGPDVLAEGCDHTLRSAIAKAMAEVEVKLAYRARKTLHRLRSNLQTPAPPRERHLHS